MLPKQYRLPLRTELKRLKKEGRLFQGKLFGLLINSQSQTSNSRPQTSKFAFIISNKIHKKAVKRNRAKRLLSAVIIEFSPKLKSGFEGVFLAKKPLIEADFNQVKKEVEKIFKKIGILP